MKAGRTDVRRAFAFGIGLFVLLAILGALLEARRQALEHGLNYVVCLGETPEPGVARILEITGLVPVFPVVRTREEALATARATTPADA